MFCPQCAALNGPKQGYCRQCGQALGTVHLILDGRADEAITKYRKGGDSLVGGLVTFGIFFQISIVAFLFGGVWPFAINIVVGIAISLPFIVKGVMRLQHAEKLLSAQDKPGALSAGQSTPSLPAPQTNELLDVQVPGSVTEHTTLDLRPPEPRSDGG